MFKLFFLLFVLVLKGMPLLIGNPVLREMPFLNGRFQVYLDFVFEILKARPFICASLSLLSTRTCRISESSSWQPFYPIIRLVSAPP